MTAGAVASKTSKWSVLDKPGAWIDLGLTLPLFLLYHLGVITLPMKNGADFLTAILLDLAEGSRAAYLGITALIGAAVALPFVLMARGQVFRPQKFFQVILEGSLYASLMGFSVPRIVGYLFARVGGSAEGVEGAGRIAGLIMSCGAGFYEELAFRVVLFGLGGKALVWLFAHEKVDVIAGTDAKPRRSWRAAGLLLAWGLAASVVFSGIHYVGPLGDSFRLSSFLARVLLGAILTLVFVSRGFATAVWTHALYDMWILVVRI